MPRSHSENDNAQFVQELAEVDGPFESPININFRDLTKLELPSLVWNRNECSPKKMKITNTGHTVIISGKWKSERPYLTGGPLLGKYVFSQIHFHWGQDDCRGSEHQVCGEAFPLEMHVAHFKTDYLTQECALREKDGMVVVVYLFKLQDEPNLGLKKILSVLPYVKQASTSHAVDPRPILSLCNPFTDDYFMYWGSVVTSTCAHILLWIVCREPFGISREQVNEFRKICDLSQQPICRNNRDPQPLHRRNVFHVNASKNLDDPLLPIKKMMGCYCKGSGENVSIKSTTNDCSCQPHLRNQEDIEGGTVDNRTDCRSSGVNGKQALKWKAGLPRNFFVHQSIYVQSPMIQSVPLLTKRFNSDTLETLCNFDSLKQSQSEENAKIKAISQSCCFFPMKEVSKIKSRQEKRKPQNRKLPFNSVKALSHILNSLETLKNQTFKKLKEIESINQEIKGMKPFCQDNEDKRWLRKIEKIMSRQKRFTIRTSRSCFTELKKLAKDCNLDKFFDNKLPIGDNNSKFVWANPNEISNRALPCSDVCMNNDEQMEAANDQKAQLMKSININKTIKFSTKAQKLIQSFFEDIKDSENLQQCVQNDLQLKKIENFNSKGAEDSTSVASVNKGYITQKMFTLGNLGNRLFTEVTVEDTEIKDNGWGDKIRSDEMITYMNETPLKEFFDSPTKNSASKIKLLENQIPEIKPFFNLEEVIPLHRANVPIEFSPRTQIKPEKGLLIDSKSFLSNKDQQSPVIEIVSDTESTMESANISKHSFQTQYYLKKSYESSFKKDLYDFTCENLTNNLDPEEMLNNFQYNSSNLSSDSAETQRMIIAKFHKKQYKNDVWKEKSSLLAKISSRGLHRKGSFKKHNLRNINFEGYYIKKNNFKNKNKKIYLKKKGKEMSSCDISSTSKEGKKAWLNKSKWERMTKTKFKLEIEKTSDSTIDSTFECSLLSPKKKKLKLECKKVRENTLKVRLPKKERKMMSGIDSDTQSADTSKTMNAFQNQETIAVQTIQMFSEEADEISKLSPEKESSEKTKNKVTQINLVKHNANNTINGNKESATQTFRASSADSKPNISGNQETENPKNDNSITFIKSNSIKKNVQKLPLNNLTKNKSFTSLSERTHISFDEVKHKICTENLDQWKKTAKETSEFSIKKLESSKQFEESQRISATQQARRAASNETYKKSDAEGEQKEGNSQIEEKKDTSPQKIHEFNVGFFTTTSRELPQEVITKAKTQEGKSKNVTSKRCEVEKYHFLDKELQEVKNLPQEPKEEIPQLSKTQSGTSEVKEGPNIKDEAVLLKADTKDLQTSVSCSTIKKNCQSRPHSAESLTSLKKSVKRKSKKRPHCCKRSSRHYIRKNSSIFRKPNKIESKPIQFLNLTEEEQLNIISVNVAKYLKQKLVEQKRHCDLEKNCNFNEIKEVVLKNLKTTEEKVKEIPATEINSLKEPAPKRKEIPVLKLPEILKKEKLVKAEMSQKKDEKNLKASVQDIETVKDKKISSSKPVHNFIKLNKKLAGKYKKLTPPPDRKLEVLINKNDELKKELSKPKIKTLKKKKEKFPLSKRENETKQKPELSQPPENCKFQKKSKEIKNPKVKTAATLAKQQSLPIKKIKKEMDSSTLEKPKEEPQQEEILKEAQSSLALEKMSPTKKRWVPAYMLTSYLPPPLEIIENQQRKMNRYLFNMKKPGSINYFPEVLYETKSKQKENEQTIKDSLLTKDVEYLIKLQKYFNNDISTNVENSMNYVKTLLSQDYNNSAIIEKGLIKDPLDYYGSRSKGIVLIEMNELLDCSSSSSDYTQDSGRYCLHGDSSDSKSKLKRKLKEKTQLKIPKESGDSEIINPSFIGEFDKHDDYNSDSSYNCEISITLNPSAAEKDGEIHIYDPASCIDEFTNNYTYDLGRESNISQATTQLDRESSSQSLILRPHRKKRNENEISAEMKQKLLEILEGEIKREIALTYGISSENSSEGLTIRWDDSDGMNRSQSTDSSCDNMEVLAQISETMRQYLTDFKEKRRLAKKSDKQLDNERKEEE